MQYVFNLLLISSDTVKQFYKLYIMHSCPFNRLFVAPFVATQASLIVQEWPNGKLGKLESCYRGLSC